MNFCVVAYDIPDSKRRNQVANILLDYGNRVQYSVFEVWLTGRTHRELHQRLGQVIDGTADSVRLYRLCADCRGGIRMLGTGQKTPPPGPLIV